MAVWSSGAPVTKLGTFLDEQADMTGYAPVLSDTLSEIAFLARKGRVDAATRQGAEAYLRQVDKGWSAAPPITSATLLYLDDLTVTYLDHVGLLDTLIDSVAI